MRMVSPKKKRSQLPDGDGFRGRADYLGAKGGKKKSWKGKGGKM